MNALINDFDADSDMDDNNDNQFGSNHEEDVSDSSPSVSGDAANESERSYRSLATETYTVGGGDQGRIIGVADNIKDKDMT